LNVDFDPIGKTRFPENQNLLGPSCSDMKLERNVRKKKKQGQFSTIQNKIIKPTIIILNVT
jgi:hypothetical protein